MLKLKLAIEGFYSASTSKLNIRDTITAMIRSYTSPYGILKTSKVVIDSVTLTGYLNASSIDTGYYYVSIEGRNCLETWSASNGIHIGSSDTLFYDFTTFASQAYGSNQVVNGSKFCIYSGDVTDYGSIDGTDVAQVGNDAANFLTGYVESDLDGNYFVDASDFVIVDNNASQFISKIVP